MGTAEECREVGGIRSVKRRDRAFVVVTAGVTSVHGGLPAPALAIGKGQHPPSGIWTVTEVTQKPCHLLYPARVQRRSTGSGTGGRGEDNSRVEEDEAATGRASVAF